jgi:serine/threonine protein kinase
VAFALGIGPKIELMFGFDMICYQNCSFFFMEQCKAINGKYIPQSLEEVLTQIKQSLKLMHSLKIIHNDIKSENIMYSPHHKKVVFIDFGITQLVR